jgi:sporulation protein YlmC with PRC-barrel domain
MSLIGGARGVIIPHQFVKAISDIMIINKSALPNPESDIEELSGDLI